jgi:hypothetical protein
MNEVDLLKVLLKTNADAERPVDEEKLRNILHLVILYPLDDDREKCQEEIRKVVSHKTMGV